VFKSYRFRLEPTPEQAAVFTDWCGAKRFVWNKALALCETRLANGHFIPRFNELNKILTLWKQAEEWKFIKEPPKDILQIALMDLDKAFAACFKGQRRKPHFKRKHDDYQSFQIAGQSLKVDNNKIWLPKIKQWVKFRRHRKVKGYVKNATISTDALGWHVSILCEVEQEQKAHTEPIGIDVGVKRLATMSDGSYIEPLDFDRDVVKLAHHQEVMARRVKGSAGWTKAKVRVQKAYRHIANRRNDYLQKETSKLATASLVAVEDLKIKNMSKSAKGTIEIPGTNVAQKRGLNRAIMQQGWGIFFNLLEQKVTDNGGQFIKVPPEYSSQTCSVCGAIDKANRESQSRFVCKSCGYEINADHNAARNLLTRGLRGIACGKGGVNACGA
jgi:putative transposase